MADLTRLAGSLPLAVSLLARVYARHRSWSLADLAAEARAQLLTMKAEQASVAAAFEVSVAHLEPAWQELFACLGLHPGTSFDACAAAALAGVSLTESQRLLDALHGEGLLIETACRRYGMHDLIRRYSRDRAGQSMTSEDQAAAVGRLLDYYQHAAGRAQALIATPTRGGRIPGSAATSALAPRLTGDEDALAWLRAERASLLACLDHAATQQMPERVVALTAGLSELLRRDGPWAARALAMFGDLGDQPGEASASVLLADTQRLTGDYSAAARLLVRALSVFEAVGDPLGETKALLSLGVVRRLTGDYPCAAAAAQRALILSRQLGRQRDHAQALVLAGDVRKDTGDCPAAITAAEQALDLYRDVGDRNGEACALRTLGAAQRAASNYPAAISALMRGLSIWKDVGHRYCKASTLLYLGAVRRETHDYPAAAAHLGEALRTFLDNGDRGGAAEALNETGALHLARGDLTAAGHCYRQALDLARQIGSPVDEETALAGLGRCADAPADLTSPAV
ncbi:MAG: tetratricopeptide repeat protein [Streptosporangiaceae bacterium]